MSINLFLISFFIYLSFLPISVCAFSPFLFFLLFSLLCYPSRICLFKLFNLSVLRAETLNFCMLLHLGGGREFPLLLRTRNLIKDFQEKFPTEVVCFYLYISKVTALPSPFLVKLLFIWMSYKQYPVQNNAPDVCFLPSSYTNNLYPFAI